MSESGHSWVTGSVILAITGAIIAPLFYCIYKDSQQQEQAILRWKERCAKEAQDESDFKKELERVGYVQSLTTLQLEIISRMSDDTEYISILHKIATKIEEERIFCDTDAYEKTLLSKDPLTRKLVTQKALIFFRLLRLTSQCDVDAHFRTIDGVNSALKQLSS